MLSIPHLIIIFLAALILFGPEKLPELARTLSKAMLEFNKATGGLKQTLQDEMRQLEREITEQRGAKPPAPVAHAEPAPAPETSWPPEPEVEPPHGKPLPGATTESESESPSAQPEGEDNQAPDPTPGNPNNGHPTAA
jgi:sec-independent protein translocase protein TatA